LHALDAAKNESKTMAEEFLVFIYTSSRKLLPAEFLKTLGHERQEIFHLTEHDEHQSPTFWASQIKW
jgi:hypothetical protein